MALVWLQRLGLSLELLGAILLALDVFEDRIRNIIREGVKQTIQAYIGIWLIMIPVAAPLYIVERSFLVEFFGPILFVTRGVVFDPLEALPLPRFYTENIHMFIALAVTIFFGREFSEQPFPVSLLRYGETLRRMELPPGIERVGRIVYVYLTGLVVLLGLTGIVISLIPVMYMAVIFTAVLIGPTTPLFYGFRLERKNRVSSGLRFLGLLLLVFGFGIQLVWTFT